MMEQTVKSEMIVLARESRGLTQSELSEILQVSQGKISKIEHGIMLATDEIIESISKVLNYPKEFFYEDIIPSAGFSYHRKRMSMTVKSLDEIYAKINIKVHHIRRLLQSVSFEGAKTPYYDFDDDHSPVEKAAILRDYWELPKGPIANLMRTMENNGIIIVMFDFLSSKIDGLSLTLHDLPPIIFVNSTVSGDRLRFTLAHELGHVIMHRYPTDSMEEEADAFASEFLMPKEIITPQLYNLDLHKLPDLKQYWKVSMASIIMRATKLDCISPSKARTLWLKFSKLGYRTKEPIEIPKEHPELLPNVVNFHLKDLNYTNEEMSKLLLLNIEEFEETYNKKEKIFKLFG